MDNEKRVTLLDKSGNKIDMSKTKSLESLDREFVHWGGSSTSVSVHNIEKEPYKYHPLLFSCCYVILKNVSRLPWALFNESNPDELIYDHELLSRLRNPNQLMTKIPFLQAILLNILLPGKTKESDGGQCFLVCLDKDGEECDLVRGDTPEFIFPYSDEFISPVVQDINGLGGLTGWKFEIPGKPNSKKVYSLSSIVRIYQFNPYQWLKGLSNSTPALMALQSDLKASLYNDSTFDNFGVPAGVLSTDMPLSPEQRQENLRHWNHTMTGPVNSSKTAMLSKGLKYQHIGLTSVDMQFKDLKANLRDTMISPYGLNKIALGNYEQINRATLEEGRRMLWHDTYLPFCDLITEALISSWVQYVEPGLRIKLDTSKVPPLQPNLKPKAEVAKIFVVDLTLPPAMAMEKAGLPLSTEELSDAPWLLENPLELRRRYSTFQLPTETPTPKAVEDDRTIIKVIKEERDKFWFSYVKATLDPNEKSYSSSLRTFFNAQRNSLQDNIDKWLKEQEKAVTVDDILFIRSAEDKKIIEVSEPYFASQLRLSEKQLIAELGELINWNVTDDTIQASLARRSRFLKGVNTTTFNTVGEQIREVLDKAIPNNWTPNEIAKELKKSVNKVYEKRKGHALTIARTELGSVTSDSRYVAFVMENIERHEWITAIDGKERESHNEENGTVINVGDRFPTTGLLHPLDPSTGRAEEVINCRCVTVAVEE